MIGDLSAAAALGIGIFSMLRLNTANVTSPNVPELPLLPLPAVGDSLESTAKTDPVPSTTETVFTHRGVEDIAQWLQFTLPISACMWLIMCLHWYFSSRPIPTNLAPPASDDPPSAEILAWTPPRPTMTPQSVASTATSRLSSRQKRRTPVTSLNTSFGNRSR